MIKLKELIRLVQSLYFPKTWLSLVDISSKLLKVSFLLVQITLVPVVILIGVSYASNFLIESSFGYISIGLVYFYLIVVFHLCLWIVLPSMTIVLLNRVLNKS